jgi:hypothetical protein
LESNNFFPTEEPSPFPLDQRKYNRSALQEETDIRKIKPINGKEIIHDFKSQHDTRPKKQPPRRN